MTKGQTDLLRRTGADFSECRRYRYRLWRYWDEGPPGPKVFIMLNPSTADEHANDPTVERCERFARAWGATGLIVVNLFAWRATDPSELTEVEDPVGPANDDWILEEASVWHEIICAWGNHGDLHGRGREVAEMLRDFDLKCLGVNQTGHPVHPLYQPASAEPIPFVPEWGD